MFNIIVLTPDYNGITRNYPRDYVYVFVSKGDEDFFSLGGFVPDTIGGNPYSCYMRQIELLAKNFPEYHDLNIDSTDAIMVYSMRSGSLDYHNDLIIGKKLNRLQA